MSETSAVLPHVMAATQWRTNGLMIVDCVRLGYLRPEWLTLDPTYGRGVWWNDWQPDVLVKHDLYELDGVDFRFLPEPDATFDAVAYDPPYISAHGTQNLSGDRNDRYGQIGGPTTPATLQVMMHEGLTEMHRVVKPRGIVLAKCADYVNSGLWAGSHFFLAHALGLGFTLKDRLYRIGNEMPSRHKQVHARQNLSTLLILQRSRHPHSN